MKIFKISVYWDEGPPTIFIADAIENEGQMWLVPMWHETRDGTKIKPARTIALENLPLQEHRGDEISDYTLNYPLPKALFEQTTPPTGLPDELVVVDLPDVTMSENDSVH